MTLILATLNRETAVFLVLLHAMAGPFTRARIARTIAFGAIWLAIFVGLRWWFGVEHYDYWQIRRNLEFLKLLPPPYDPYYRAYAWFVVFLFGPLLFVALRGLKGQPLFIRRALWVVPAILFVGFTHLEHHRDAHLHAAVPADSSRRDRRGVSVRSRRRGGRRGVGADGDGSSGTRAQGD